MGDDAVDYIDAGELRERITVLRLGEEADGWHWAAAQRSWARVVEGKGKNLFSSVGLGAVPLTLTLRRQELSLHDAIAWRGRHCFLTGIRDNGRLYLDVEAALVETVPCRADVHRAHPGPVFPGVLTEKYMRHEEPEPMALTVQCYVLVTPKSVALELGGLVEIGAERYTVRLAHTLDPYKNEYEVLSKRDK